MKSARTINRYNVVILCLALIALSMTPRLLHASMVTVELVGEVETVHSELAGTFSVGDTYRCTLVYESSTPDSFTSGSLSGHPASQVGFYNGAILELSFEIENALGDVLYSATATPNPSGLHLAIYDDWTVGSITDDHVRSGLTAVLGEWAGAPTVAGLSLNRLAPVGLNSSPSVQAMSSDALTTINWNLSDYAAEHYFFLTFGTAPERSILGQLTSITVGLRKQTNGLR